MNVVLLGPFGLHPKGTMRARALPAARALARRGHDATVIMPPWHTPEAAGRRWADPESSVRLEYVALDGLRFPVAGHLAVAWRMARRAASLRPDVVHAFKPKAYSGLAASVLWLAQRLGARFAVVVDTDDWEGPGGWNELEPYSRGHRAVFARQERWGLRSADAVTVASRALEALVWSLGVPPDRVAYLPNAVDVADNGEEGRGADGPQGRSGALDAVLLYTRFFEFDPARPLEVLRRVRDRVPDARLVVAGQGLFGEDARFLDRARDLGLAGAVEHRGWVEPDALEQVLSSAEVALFPFDDTLVNRTKSSVKLLELMHAGLAVVADAVGENAEVIENGRSGVLVPPGDVIACAEAITELLADADRRRAIGKAARQRVADRYSWSRQAAALEAVYGDAQRRRRRDGPDDSRREPLPG